MSQASFQWENRKKKKTHIQNVCVLYFIHYLNFISLALAD